MDVTQEVMQIAQQYLRKVRRSGNDNIDAICPFHIKPDGTEEKNPSFRMSLSRGVFFCHACHARGNLRSFLKAIGLDRGSIEQWYGFLIDEAAKNRPPDPDPLKPLVFELPAIDEAILGIFDYCPHELLDDGFTQKTLMHFEVGFDRWFNRITYPLRDLNGKLIGIMGRNPDGDGPKYKVYTREYGTWRMPAASEPDKRAILWNAHNVYPTAYFCNPGETSVVVVEGFKAAMWLYQAGITNVVALLGSYLSWEHKWILERIGATVYLFLDNNYAGRSGTIQAADALSKSLTVHVVEYPSRLIDDEDAQPDSLLPIEVSEQLAKAPTYTSWILQHVRTIE